MKENKLTVYYDGACYICAHEISLYRRRDKKNNIIFKDISEPQFDVKAEGLNRSEIVRVFHARLASGELITGVDAFMAIWENIESLNFLARLAKFRMLRLVLDLGYKVFVIVRPLLPRKKCETNACEL